MVVAEVLVVVNIIAGGSITAGMRRVGSISPFRGNIRLGRHDHVEPAGTEGEILAIGKRGRRVVSGIACIVGWEKFNIVPIQLSRGIARRTLPAGAFRTQHTQQRRCE